MSEDRAVNVDVATSEDMEAIIALTQIAHAESRYARYPYAQVRLRKYVAQILNDTDGRQTRIFLARVGDEVVGLAAAGITPLIYSTARVASTMLFFVEAAHRGGSVPPRLLAALSAWAREKEAVELTMHVTRGEEEGAERINRFFRAKGFEASGENLHLRL